MKTSIIIIRILIAFMVMFLMLELSLELDIARRRLNFDKQILADGSSYYDNKTKEDIITEKQDWNKSQLFLFKFLFIWNTSIVFLVLLMLFLQWKAKNITTKD